MSGFRDTSFDGNILSGNTRWIFIVPKQGSSWKPTEAVTGIR